ASSRSGGPITPDECPSIRSMARCVLPVLVGPSTAVTPAPGARSAAYVEGEKAMSRRCFFYAFVIARSEAVTQSIVPVPRDGLLPPSLKVLRRTSRFARNDGSLSG